MLTMIKMLGRSGVIESGSNHATPTLSSEIVPRDGLVHRDSLQSRQLRAVVDGPDVCVDRAERCNIV